MRRWEVINHYIDKRYKDKCNYLEIGIHHGENYTKIKASNRTGVEPNPIFRSSNIYTTTSDEFFVTNKKIFDLIFIDGSHTALQSERDFWNAFQCVSVSGMILMHDCAPTKENETFVPRPSNHGRWNGEVYKTWLKIRKIFPDCTFTIDTDEGIGVFDMNQRWEPTVHWANYEKSKSKLLNLISLESFKAMK